LSEVGTKKGCHQCFIYFSSILGFLPLRLRVFASEFNVSQRLEGAKYLQCLK